MCCRILIAYVCQEMKKVENRWSRGVLWLHLTWSWITCKVLATFCHLSKPLKSPLPTEAFSAGIGLQPGQWCPLPTPSAGDHTACHIDHHPQACLPSAQQTGELSAAQVHGLPGADQIRISNPQWWPSLSPQEPKQHETIGQIPSGSILRVEHFQTGLSGDPQLPQVWRP